MNIAKPLARSLVQACLCLIPAASSAEHHRITYESALEQARARSPLIKQLEARRASEQAEAIRIASLPNPELSSEIRPYSGDSDGKDVEYEISISQTLKPSHFGTRGSIANLMRSVSDIDSKLELLEFSQSLFLAYCKLWSLQERQRYLEKLQRYVGELSAKISKSGQSGAIPASTQKLLESSRRKLSIERDGVAGDATRARAELLQRVGTLPESPLLEEPKLAPVPVKIDVRDAALPLRRKLELRAQLAREQARGARLDAFPSFSPRIGFEHTDEGDNRINVGLTFDLPFFDRNQAAIHEKAHAASARNADLIYLNSGALEREIALLAASVAALRTQAERYRTELLPVLEQTYSAAEREVLSGQSSPIQLWQLVENLSETQQRALEIWVKAVSAQAELSVLTGVDL